MLLNALKQIKIVSLSFGCMLFTGLEKGSWNYDLYIMVYSHCTISHFIFTKLPRNMLSTLSSI